MLLPSALSCDTSHPPATAGARLQAALFASPPASPPTLSPQNALGSIFNTCRSLQALLATPATAPPAPATQLPTPPMTHATPPPLRLRLRSRSKPEAADHLTPRKKIVKRAPPRGANKRRRAMEDDLGRDDILDDDAVSDLEIGEAEGDADEFPRPSTPKRARIAPEVVPLGLERWDFHDLHLQHKEEAGQSSKPAEGTDAEADNEEWTTEDDRILVELVLEKLKLSKTDWQDCARSLGKDRHSVGRRWKSLMVHGDVGLKTRSSSRRAKLHSTWR